MKHSRTDTQSAFSSPARTGRPGQGTGAAAVPGRRGGLRHLPRPVYGHIDSQSNILIPRHHKHAWAQLSYATQGYLQVWTPDARFVALAQRAVWIPAGVAHQRVSCTEDFSVVGAYPGGTKWDLMRGLPGDELRGDIDTPLGLALSRDILVAFPVALCRFGVGGGGRGMREARRRDDAGGHALVCCDFPERGGAVGLRRRSP